MSQLTKTSNAEEIKAYFNGILKLKQDKQEFPVDFDDVWMLAYDTRHQAMNSLRYHFIEGVDFILFQQGKQVLAANLKNGVKSTAKITTGCLEYYVARKVRPVFEVYRQVFDKVVEEHVAPTTNVPMTPTEALLMAVQQMVEQEKRIASVEERLDKMDEERVENGRLLLSASLSEEETPQLSLRQKINQLARAYGSAANISMQDVWHKIYYDLYYLYSIQLTPSGNENRLDVAEQRGVLDKVYNVISSIIKQYNANKR